MSEMTSKDGMHLAIGKAISAYAKVEAAQAKLLTFILRIGLPQATTIFYTLQNVRSRSEMYETLITQANGSLYSAYWKSFSLYLSRLAKFRNAVVHWHPFLIDEMGERDGPIIPPTPGIQNPSPTWPLAPLTEKDIPPFLDDCAFAEKEMWAFCAHIRDAGSGVFGPWPEKFHKSLARQNQAVLRPRQTAKAPEPRRGSSQG